MSDRHNAARESSHFDGVVVTRTLAPDERKPARGNRIARRKIDGELLVSDVRSIDDDGFGAGEWNLGKNC